MYGQIRVGFGRYFEVPIAIGMKDGRIEVPIAIGMKDRRIDANSNS